MGELAIRRERSVSGPRYRAAERTEKAAGAKSQPPARTAGATVSETLQRLMTHIGRAEASTRESHRTLQVGEAVLDEVQSALGRMAELAEKAASAGADTRALQAELERLRGEIDRMTGGARSGGDRLFLDGDMEIEEGAEPPADAGEEEAVQPLPDWLLKGLGQNGIRPGIWRRCTWAPSSPGDRPSRPPISRPPWRVCGSSWKRSRRASPRTGRWSC